MFQSANRFVWYVVIRYDNDHTIKFYESIAKKLITLNRSLEICSTETEIFRLCYVLCSLQLPVSFFTFDFCLMYICGLALQQFRPIPKHG